MSKTSTRGFAQIGGRQLPNYASDLPRLATMKDGDDRRRIREVDSLRHTWAESAMRDRELRRFPTALALVTYVRKRFRSDLGYAEFSLSGAARDLNMPRRSVVRARDKLVERGWLRLVERRMDQSKGWAANRYTLSGGPEDLLLTQHRVSVTDDTCDPGDTDDTIAGVSDDTEPVT